MLLWESFVMKWRSKSPLCNESEFNLQSFFHEVEKFKVQFLIKYTNISTPTVSFFPRFSNLTSKQASFRNDPRSATFLVRWNAETEKKTPVFFPWNWNDCDFRSEPRAIGFCINASKKMGAHNVSICLPEWLSSEPTSLRLSEEKNEDFLERSSSRLDGSSAK